MCLTRATFDSYALVYSRKEAEGPSNSDSRTIQTTPPFHVMEPV